MTYHLSSEQYQRGVERITQVRLLIAEGVMPASTPARVLGMADLLAHLASVPTGRVIRDSDARLAGLDSQLPGCVV